MRIFLDTTGCRLNQSEIETLARQFTRAGHTIVSSASEADMCVMNTCAVTREATRTSRNTIRRMNRSNPRSEIIATGCYAHLNPDVVMALPGVSQVVNNLDKDRLVPLVLGLDEPVATFEQEPLDREQGSGDRLIANRDRVR